MEKQCNLCGGNTTFYLTPPSGYCLTHNAWFTSSKKCASVTSDECIEYDTLLWSITAAEQQPELARRLTLQTHMDAVHPGHGAAFGLVPTQDIEEIHKKYYPTCDITKTPIPKGDPSKGFLIRDVSARKYAGWICPTDGTFTPEFIKEAVFQKEAMWYVMKPRWIIRRKIAAAVRRKVRTIFQPVSLKM